MSGRQIAPRPRGTRIGTITVNTAGGIERESRGVREGSSLDHKASPSTGRTVKDCGWKRPERKTASGAEYSKSHDRYRNLEAKSNKCYRPPGRRKGRKER